MESIKSSFDLEMNLTDLKDYLDDICYNKSSSSRMMFLHVDERRRKSSYAQQRVFLDVHVVGPLRRVSGSSSTFTW